MKKLFVTFLATIATLFIITWVVGGRMWATAFYIPGLHHAVSYMCLTGLCVSYSIWRIVKGK